MECCDRRDGWMLMVAGSTALSAVGGVQLCACVCVCVCVYVVASVRGFLSVQSQWCCCCTSTELIDVTVRMCEAQCTSDSTTGCTSTRSSSITIRSDQTCAERTAAVTSTSGTCSRAWNFRACLPFVVSDLHGAAAAAVLPPTYLRCHRGCDTHDDADRPLSNLSFQLVDTTHALLCCCCCSS